MSQELVGTFAKYPAYVIEDGWRVTVSVRVQAYMDGVKAWKRQLAAAHPDLGGSAAAFRRLKTKEAHWREREAEWFISHGLDVPRFGEPAAPPPMQSRTPSGRMSSALVLEQLRASRRPLTVDELLSRLEIKVTPKSQAQIVSAIRALRQRGATISRIVQDPQQPAAYVLVSDRNYVSKHEHSEITRVARILSDGEWHTARAIAAAEGIQRMNVPAAARHGVPRGFVLEVRHGAEDGRRMASYRLVPVTGEQQQ